MKVSTIACKFKEVLYGKNKTGTQNEAAEGYIYI